MNFEDRLLRFWGQSPKVPASAYIAQGAVVIGDVTLGAESSVWFGAVLRGDINRIEVGKGSNIQDNAVVHLADDFPCLIGDFVTVGHSAILHACTVEDECLIGMGATILDGAVIGAQSIVGAKALVTGGTVIPPGSLVLGSPAKWSNLSVKRNAPGSSTGPTSMSPMLAFVSNMAFKSGLRFLPLKASMGIRPQALTETFLAGNYPLHL